MKRAVLFKGVYATLDLFTEEIQRVLIYKGYEVMMFDVNDYQASLMKFAAFAQRPVQMVISYNNLGFNMELVPGKNVWEQLGITFVNILVDHPFHYKEALDTAPANSIILCIDRKHVEYIKRFWTDITRVYFMPHGTSYIDCGKQWEDRTIDVLYAGGLSVDLIEGLRPDVEKYKDFDATDLVEYATDRLISKHSLTTEEVIEEYLKQNNVEYDDLRLSQIISDFRIIDSYAVSYFREKVIEKLVNNGIRVTVYGRGWDKRPCIENPNFIFGGYVKPDMILELMKDAKVVLNTMTWFKDGSHVRIFNGMMTCAVCMTDYSKYISEVIQDGKNGFVFELDNLDKMLSDISTILNDGETAKQIAICGRDEAMKSHTFESRVDFILGLL